jgi:hypothetical protein
MKLLLHLAARRGAEEAVASWLDELGRELAAKGDGAFDSVATLWRVAQDPFGPGTPWAGTLEVCAGRGAGPAELAEVASTAARRFVDVVHADLSTALVGTDHVIIEPGRPRVRYQYLMRRREGFTHESYLRRYREIHSQFGFKTPAIRGYVQCHLDPAATREAARAAGFGVCEVDSVSELHMDSLERFMEAIADSTIGAEAMADEEVFVDRSHSYAFCSNATWHAPRPS